MYIAFPSFHFHERRHDFDCSRSNVLNYSRRSVTLLVSAIIAFAFRNLDQIQVTRINDKLSLSRHKSRYVRRYVLQLVSLSEYFRMRIFYVCVRIITGAKEDEGS